MRLVVLLGKLVILEHLLVEGGRWREHHVLVSTMVLGRVHHLVIHGRRFGEVERGLLVVVIFGEILLHATPSIDQLLMRSLLPSVWFRQRGHYSDIVGEVSFVGARRVDRLLHQVLQAARLLKVIGVLRIENLKEDLLDVGLIGLVLDDLAEFYPVYFSSH